MNANNAGSVAATARPILFSAEMVRALLDGRKTQTRRVAKVNLAGRVARGGRNWNCADPDAVRACPYDVGQLLWVRETYCLEREIEGDKPPHSDGRPILLDKNPFDGAPAWTQPHYRATDPAPELFYEYGTCRHCEYGEPHAHWKPSIHMPRWASRITLCVTGVRLERLQDITADDAAAEGVQIPVNADTGRPMLEISGPLAAARYLADPQVFDQGAWLRAHFASLWDRTSIDVRFGLPWAGNPLVWVIAFTVHRANVDQLLRDAA